MRYLKLGTALVLVLLLMSGAADARQFRQLAPIAVAPQVLESSGIGPDAVPLTPEGELPSVENLSPVPENSVEKAIEDILLSWNTEGLEQYLDQYFPNRFQLLNVLQQDIPADASLQLLSVQNVSTLSQFWGRQAAPRSRISNVVATVRLQLRFVDPYKGVISLPHTARFYLRVVESE